MKATLINRMNKFGQVTVPAEIRKMMGLGEGDFLYFSPEEGKIVVSALDVAPRDTREVLAQSA